MKHQLIFPSIIHVYTQNYSHWYSDTGQKPAPHPILLYRSFAAVPQQT